MATIAAAQVTREPHAPDSFERILSVGAIILFAFVAAAVAKGASEWRMITPLVWIHLIAMTFAVGLSPIMLLRPRGTALHRTLGRVWAVAMLVAAVISFQIRDINHGGFSFIHILSAYTAIQVPILVWSARTHNVKRHRRSVRAMVTGALLVAGFFTFPFNRLLGSWLFG